MGNYTKDHKQFVMVRIRRPIYDQLVAWAERLEQWVRKQKHPRTGLLVTGAGLSASSAVAELLRRDEFHRARRKASDQKRRGKAK